MRLGKKGGGEVKAWKKVGKWEGKGRRQNKGRREGKTGSEVGKRRERGS